ncbi:UVH3 [Symbiodinium natans]|uniref:UVH3 protein n=1 Tax=Symbiodinium natans TaxID=878477 RepID=A0A812Q9M1_9DINO|nr:UVH3 [Symbiodinium natans]
MRMRHPALGQPACRALTIRFATLPGPKIPWQGGGETEEAMSWLEAPSADEAESEDFTKVAQNSLEEDVDNAEDLFGASYFDEAKCRAVTHEPDPEVRPAKRLRHELQLREEALGSGAVTNAASTVAEASAEPSEMQVEVEVEEAVEEVEVEEEQEEEEEDGLEEDPAHKLRSQDVDEGKGPPPDEAVDLEGCSGSQSCETGLACRPSDAPVFTGRGYETSGSLTRPPSPMEGPRDASDCPSEGPTNVKEASRALQVLDDTSQVARPTVPQVEADEGRDSGMPVDSQPVAPDITLAKDSKKSEAGCSQGLMPQSAAKDAADSPQTGEVTSKPPLINPVAEVAEAAARTAAAAAASQMAPKPGSISASASSTDGVWCNTHFQYRWRCRQDGVSDACEASTPQPSSSSGSKGKATKGKGKGSGGGEEATLGDDELEELEFQRLAAELEDEHRELRAEARRAKRGADVVTPEMQADVEALLEALGIPYVHAPAEAEAQCAFLAEARLVDAVASDDSDVLVFGAREVYRRLFSEDQLVECYSAARLESCLGLLQDHLVVLAMLLGCDYTLGVHGVGIVNGLEIVRAFSPGRDMANTEAWLQHLKNFRTWSQNVANWGEESAGVVAADGKSVAEFKRKHTNFRTQWSFPDDFPSAAVIDAFHRPEVDRSLEPFTWAQVDLRRAAVLLQKACDLSEEKILERLEPAVRRYEDSLRQPRITEYMVPGDAGQVAVVRSSRMQRALRGLRGESPEPDNAEAAEAANAAEVEAEGPQRRRRRRAADAEEAAAPRARGRGRGRGRARQGRASAAFASLGGAASAHIELDDSE